MNITPTTEQLADYLKSAKELHSELYGNDPNHDWVSFYAEYIRLQILLETARQMNGEVGLEIYKQSKNGPTIHDFSSPETAMETISKLVDEKKWPLTDPDVYE